MKDLKAYDLYWGGYGWTCKSEVYATYSKRRCQVAAVSIKQAYYLASNDIWFDGKTGILTVDNGDRNSPNAFKHWDGSTSDGFKHKHGCSLNRLRK